MSGMNGDGRGGIRDSGAGGSDFGFVKVLPMASMNSWKIISSLTISNKDLDLHVGEKYIVHLHTCMFAYNVMTKYISFHKFKLPNLL